MSTKLDKSSESTGRLYLGFGNNVFQIHDFKIEDTPTTTILAVPMLFKGHSCIQEFVNPQNQLLRGIYVDQSVFESPVTYVQATENNLLVVALDNSAKCTRVTFWSSI